MPPPAVVVPGPGPAEPSQTGAATGNLVQTDEEQPAQNGAQNGTQNGEHADLMATSASQDPSSNEGDDDDGPVSAPTSAADPYAGLDSAFGGYMADEPRPQNKDLLDMI